MEQNRNPIFKKSMAASRNQRRENAYWKILNLNKTKILFYISEINSRTAKNLR